jgi:hypothetical protein
MEDIYKSYIEETHDYIKNMFNYIVIMDTKMSLMQKEIFRIQDKINNIK